MRLGELILKVEWNGSPPDGSEAAVGMGICRNVWRELMFLSVQGKADNIAGSVPEFTMLILDK